MQCPSGHTLCNSCKNKVNNKCPICRKEIGNIRCLALEKFALVLHLPCTYHHYGCSEMFPYYKQLQHEAQCIFKPYLCPHPGSNCPFSGDIPALLSHLQETHKVDLQTGCTFNHRYVKQDPCSVDNLAWTLTVSSDFYNCAYFLNLISAFIIAINVKRVEVLALKESRTSSSLVFLYQFLGPSLSSLTSCLCGSLVAS